MLFQSIVIGISLFGAVTDPPVAKPRARELGIPFNGKPGPLNAITDVAGLTVGMKTLIEGGLLDPEKGKKGLINNEKFYGLKPGGGPARTGVTAIFPRGRDARDSCFAAIFALNGNGEMTGSHWIEESGFLDGPVLITNTSSVGIVRDATVAWQTKEKLSPYSNTFTENMFYTMPVVAETADLPLNDMNGFHVTAAHAVEALESAKGGPVAEGNVGGGTGMICHGWKGGTGTSSRKVGNYTVGVLVQANHGSPDRLTIAGVPVGKELRPPYYVREMPPGAGSIIVIIATDAPLLPTQLKRLAKRATIGVGRLGGLGENGSGDIFLAFSTANAGLQKAPNIMTQPTAPQPQTVQMISNSDIDAYFEATVDATEEAIVNVLCAAETMTGRGGFTVEALSMEKVLAILRKRSVVGAAK